MIVTTYNQTTVSNRPAVPRIDNVTTTSFDVGLNLAAATGTVTAGDVTYIVIEEGAHTLPGSVSMEAGIVSNHSGVNENGDWTNTQMALITPTNSYTNPRVLNSIHSYNDTQWQAPWNSNGAQASPPDNTAIYIGRHVGEDSTVSRLAEDLGYIIIEDSTGTTNSIQ